MRRAFDMITDDEKECLYKYISSYANCDPEDLEYVLHTWEKNKSDLFKMFGGYLRIEVPVKYDIQPNIVYSRVMSVYNCPFIDGTKKDIADFVKLVESRDDLNFVYDFILYLCQLCLDGDILVEDVMMAIRLFYHQNVISGIQMNQDTPVYDFEYNDRRVRMSSGMKFMRCVQKLVHLYGYEDIDKFNKFKNDISVATTINNDGEATVVLSIHPMDFLTMSDNTCGWTSCFSIKDHGSSCQGPVAMMNSKCAVIAYVKSGFYDFCGHKIPNMAWRSLFYVDKDIILSGKSYPYTVDPMSKEILSTLELMANINLSWKYDMSCIRYADNQFENMDDCIRLPGIGSFIGIVTKNCYNDVVEDLDYNFWCSKNLNVKKILEVTGPITCLSCGGVVSGWSHYDDDKLYCKNCYNDKYCVTTSHVHKRNDIFNIQVMNIFCGSVCVHQRVMKVCKSVLKDDFIFVGNGSYIKKSDQGVYNWYLEHNPEDWRYIYFGKS